MIVLGAASGCGFVLGMSVVTLKILNERHANEAYPNAEEWYLRRWEEAIHHDRVVEVGKLNHATAARAGARLADSCALRSDVRNFT